MEDIINESLKRMKKARDRRIRTIALLLVLSLIVSLDVFWTLRQPGLTLAGNANCGITEHTHDENCPNPCNQQEHVHTLGCYSDVGADVETQLEWQQMFDNYPYTDNLRQNLVGIAKMQVGYQESADNFQVDSHGHRHGYTRYGDWYGAPYNEWSAMFVSFCLHYAGADPDLYPGNTGASSMAELWARKGRLLPTTAYDPVPGDLVFFTDNTVGIVTETQMATVMVVRGDKDDAVTSELLLRSDKTISAWGVTQERNPQLDVIPPTGYNPRFSLTAGVSEGEAAPVPYMLRTYLRLTRSTVDLLAYLEEKGGDYFFTLMDFNNQELPKDENGNYIATANDGYKMAITFHSPEGFAPGTYQYQVPNGLMVDGGEGTFKLKDGTVVGEWTVTDTGLITLYFNELMDTHTDITITATLGIHFPEQDDPIDFDGMISVKVEPPAAQAAPTKISKWGTGNTAAGNIYWTVRLDGFADSQIPGSILTDQPALSDWSRPHSYTEADIAGGLQFGVSDPAGGWHSWHVSADDPHLVWDENGWSYKIPKTVTCDYCGELELGNEGWIYLINYTSTPTKLNTPGTFDYENKVTVDGQTGWGWSNFEHGEVLAEIYKEGDFVSDAAGGAFLWEFQATIPGRVEGQRAEYSWFIMDEMRLLNAEGIAIGHAQNDANLALVIATYNGTTINVPRIQDATDQDMFAWDNAWTATEDGISYNRTLNLVSRCRCTADTCHWQGCDQYWFQYDDGTWGTKGFCQCWTETQNMTFTFIYRSTDTAVIQSYGALGYQLNNHAQLYYMPGGNSQRVDYDDATVPIPNLFAKELTQDFDGYTANYKVTVNEAKISLTDGSPLNIRDEMTQTLAYISGSLVIYAEDAGGNVYTLKQGDDFTVTYDGTGAQKDANGNPVHVLEIVILHPQPVMYTLDYDATLIFPEQLSGAIKYSNSANITLWGDSIKDDAVEKVYADINIATKSYRVQLYKVAADTGEALPGGTFGLFNEQGGQITTATTDHHGALMFQTNITKGIILRDHILYYIQELRPPPGYKLDDTKIWFCFCDKSTDTCEVCNEVLAGLDAVRIPIDKLSKITLTNELMQYEMPETGGPGIYPLILVSVMMVVTPLVYISVRRRKREGRGVG